MEDIKGPRYSELAISDMASKLQLLLFAMLVCSSHCEVNYDFTKCKDFFYQGSPPVFTGDDLKDICQYYEKSNHYATTYSTWYRIPVFSAYLLPTGPCPGGQPERRQTWFVEPQVCSNVMLYSYECTVIQLN